MPNWCNNVVQVSHPDVSKMSALVESINAGKFCDFAIPVPESLQIVAGRVGDDDKPEQIDLVEAENRNLAEHGYKNWYDFCVAKWGTKWDVEPYAPVELQGNEITFGFDSAWSPPCGVYEALEAQGFTVKAFYYESGMAYAGIYSNGFDDYYELEGSADEIQEQIPEELDEVFDITFNLRQFEEENEEENEE